MTIDLEASEAEKAALETRISLLTCRARQAAVLLPSPVTAACRASSVGSSSANNVYTGLDGANKGDELP